MSLSKIGLFSKDLESEYNNKIDQIDKYLKYSDINFRTTEAKIQDIKFEIFEKIWSWEHCELVKNQISTNSEDITLQPDFILNEIYSGRTSIEYSSVKGIKAIYYIPIKGDKNGLTFGKRGNSVSYYGEINNTLLTLFEFSDLALTAEIGTSLRSKVNSKIDKIESRIQEFEDFLKLKSSDFLNIIGKKAKVIYDADVLRNQRNSFL